MLYVIFTLEEWAFVKFPVIVIPVSHSPKLLAETEKDNVAGLDEELPLPPPPPPPARAATPTAAIIPTCDPANPIFDAFFGFTDNHRLRLIKTDSYGFFSNE